MTLVAILTISRPLVARFRAYERAAAAIMARHGGAIARTVVIDGAELREVHIVTFPDAAALAAYRADPAYGALADERAAVILATEILVGKDGPDYHA